MSREATRRSQPLDRPWSQVRGPASACNLTLQRLGWSWPSWHTIRIHTGELFDMRRSAPSTLR
eukprot:7429373-Pyramimonas_sp.AAC.1